MKLSIIIPIFNEEKTIAQVLNKVHALEIPDIKKEIIVVDDGSNDNSKLKVQSIKYKEMKVFSHKRNMGKGAAVRTGIKHASGDYIVIQDADLEYDPKQIKKLIKPVQEKKAQVVYGTRLKRLPNFKDDEKTFLFALHYFGNRSLSLLTSLFYRHWLTDIETCYKLFPRSAVADMKLQAQGFNFEPEITTKLLKKGFRIVEIPIRTVPRDYKEGKKLHTFRDGSMALWTLVKYRFVD